MSAQLVSRALRQAASAATFAGAARWPSRGHLCVWTSKSWKVMAAQNRLFGSSSSNDGGGGGGGGGGEEKARIGRPDSMGTRGKSEPGKGKGPVGWVNLAMTGFVLVVLYASYQYAKSKKEYEKAKERKREVGKAKIGGSFDLVDHMGKAKKSEDFFGKWILLYFGFTHCPDICPDEMEKMAEVIMGKRKKEFLDN